MIPHRIPLPTSIEVCNVVNDSANMLEKMRQRTISSEAGAAHHASSSTWTSPYDTQLLPHRIRLEIRVETVSNEQKGESISGRIIYNENDPRQCGVAASFPSLSIPRSSLAVAAYDSMQAFIYSTGLSSSTVVKDGNEEISSGDLQKEGDQREVLLQSFALHPSRMCRIAQIPTPDFSLPVHCVFVTFSDQSVRMIPAQYQLLLLQETSSNMLIDGAKCIRVPEGDDPRFQEQAFSALDDLTSTNDSSGDDEFLVPSTASSPDDRAATGRAGFCTQQCMDVADEDLLLLQYEYEQEVRLSQWLQKRIAAEKASLTSTQVLLTEAQAQFQRLLHATPIPRVPPVTAEDSNYLQHQLQLSKMRLVRGVQALYPITRSNTSGQHQHLMIRGCTLEQPGAAAMVQHCAVLLCRYLGKDINVATTNVREQVADLLRDRAGVTSHHHYNNNGSATSILQLLQSIYDHILSPATISP